MIELTLALALVVLIGFAIHSFYLNSLRWTQEDHKVAAALRPIRDGAEYLSQDVLTAFRAESDEASLTLYQSRPTCSDYRLSYWQQENRLVRRAVCRDGGPPDTQERAIVGIQDFAASVEGSQIRITLVGTSGGSQPVTRKLDMDLTLYQGVSP